MDKNATDAHTTVFSARFRDRAVEERFQQDRLSQTRAVLIGVALIGVFGTLVSIYGTYLNFDIDSWVFRAGLALRVAFILLALALVVTCLIARSPATLYSWNALGLVVGCATIALRMTLPSGVSPEAAGELSLFHVSRDGVGLLLVVALAELALVPGWYAVNAAIVSLALGGFLGLVYIVPGGTDGPLNLIFTAIVAFAFVLGMGNALQRLQREAFFVHTRLREANKRLEQLARTDPLTGCANRRHFFELGEIEYERSRRYGHALSVILMDIDYFKRINDRYGHAVGDRVLQAVAEAVQKSLRRGEVLGRIGGEEFAFLLPETDINGAVTVAQRARQRIASLRASTEHGNIGVTASFGVADNTSGSADFDSLVNCADTLLYDAKHKGRDRIVVQPGTPA